MSWHFFFIKFRNLCHLCTCYLPIVRVLHYNNLLCKKCYTGVEAAPRKRNRHSTIVYTNTKQIQTGKCLVTVITSVWSLSLYFEVLPNQTQLLPLTTIFKQYIEVALRFFFQEWKQQWSEQIIFSDLCLPVSDLRYSHLVRLSELWNSFRVNLYHNTNPS